MSWRGTLGATAGPWRGTARAVRRRGRITGRGFTMINQGIGKRWDSYQPTKALAAWLCVISVAATMIVGFGWGGWVRGSTAQDVATKAASGARAELAPAVSAHQFVPDPPPPTPPPSPRGTE